MDKDMQPANNAASPERPQTVIRILVDTAYVGSVGGGKLGAGLYMVDNRTDTGSSAEGSLELYTVARLEDYIGFYIEPIHPFSGDQVSITGISVTGGDVFGSAGYPQPVNYDHWVGRACNASSRTTYQIAGSVTIAGVRPETYYFSWDPFIATA